LDFSGFYLELNVRSLNLNVIQIQTKLQNYIQSLCKILTSDVGIFPCEQPADPANPQRAQPSSPSDAAQRPHNTAAFSFLSLTCGTRDSASLLSSSSPFPPALHRTVPRRASARDGTTGPPAGTHTEPGHGCVLTSGSP
jgi:hypothetical protein